MDRYRIELTKIGDERDETLVALEGSAELVERLAGTLISGALDDSDGDDEPRDASYMTPDGPVMATDRPKRKRRTKAEIAADNAKANMATALDAAAATAAPTDNKVETTESAVAAAAEPAPASGSVGLPATVSDAVAAPYDPFAAR
jgi:hypothetical protein